MSAEEILAMCGMTRDEVKSAVGRFATASGASRMSVADMNEKKYEGVKTEEDCWRLLHIGVYTEIAAGTDNGGCTTRGGTYRKLRTGDGRCSSKEDLRYWRVRDSSLKRDSKGRFEKRSIGS